tara:strand:+ start:58 stop:495 length:438 start_codon:yes stop_codon:yes gene_type:complete
MAALAESAACLRIFGDTLNPDEITKLLGGEPTYVALKGQTFTSKAGRTRTAKTGTWQYTATRATPGDLDAQVCEILEQLTNDKQTWLELSETYEIDLFCGFFMEETNEGMTISPETVRNLAQRNVEILFEIYAPIEDESSSHGDA